MWLARLMRETNYLNFDEQEVCTSRAIRLKERVMWWAHQFFILSYSELF